jgi:hypothetical protein
MRQDAVKLIAQTLTATTSTNIAMVMTDWV